MNKDVHGNWCWDIYRLKPAARFKMCTRSAPLSGWALVGSNAPDTPNMLKSTLPGNHISNGPRTGTVPQTLSNSLYCRSTGFSDPNKPLLQHFQKWGSGLHYFNSFHQASSQAASLNMKTRSSYSLCYRVSSWGFHYQGLDLQCRHDPQPHWELWITTITSSGRLDFYLPPSCPFISQGYSLKSDRTAGACSLCFMDRARCSFPDEPQSSNDSKPANIFK